jgi:lysophospholipase L1-like esterase
MFLSGIEVNASPQVAGALITLGDSVTDGVASTTDANNRYPDWLARRLSSRSGATMSVSNAGIAGNSLLAFQPDVLLFGFSAPSRIARDVLTQAGARAVILLQGNVDNGVQYSGATTRHAREQHCGL